MPTVTLYTIITDKNKKLKRFPQLKHSFTSKSDTNLHLESDNHDCLNELSSSDEKSIHNIPLVLPNVFFVVTKMCFHTKATKTLLFK